jgi:prevent-host-death family protein
VSRWTITCNDILTAQGDFEKGHLTSFCYAKVMKSTTVSATEFKAKCLALLNQVEEKGGTITITKRGRPVAVVGPVRKEHRKSPAGMWAGKVKFPDNLESLDTSDLWDVVRK